MAGERERTLSDEDITRTWRHGSKVAGMSLHADPDGSDKDGDDSDSSDSESDTTDS
jgi:hypothetical protein